MSTLTHHPVTTAEPALLDRELLEEIAAGAAERDVDRVLPFTQVRLLDERRFGALRVPIEFGGPGVTIEQLIGEVIALAAADSNLAHLYRGHFGFVESLRFQPRDIQQTWYARILRGETVGNASTERGGNALGTLNTTLSPAGDGWVLNGEKYYSTGTIFSDYTRVSASQGEGQRGRRFAVVPIDAEGVTVIDDWDGFGQKLTGTGTTIFENVAVEPHSLLDRPYGSHEAVHEAAFFQLYLLAVQVGIAEAAVGDATATLRRRTRTFNTSATGAAFKQDPLIQQVVGRMSSKTFVAEAAVLEAARIQDRALQSGLAEGTAAGGRPVHLPEAVYNAEIAVEKAQITVPELVLGVTQELFQTVGASATLRTTGLDRHWRNAQTIATHNPMVFRARSIGDYEINGTLPEGLNAIGESTNET